MLFFFCLTQTCYFIFLTNYDSFTKLDLCVITKFANNNWFNLMLCHDKDE